ncbi:hypothetical protein ATORI0001_1578 [Lancefieldella rimae ATCC 49626]|uniref:Uncharacterized protein n=1 Tax=Lancefieldella rimae (strain ATCC 49626 / DSM 7090 / CCUG 31168 / NBRC 15546 / VPI D140H-11A) TaxID=553184 RepID=B9CMN5_LANR4|nr:hypothetical protein ATORI0001_1578 [Lancefieldella rimae ATCC 49626]
MAAIAIGNNIGLPNLGYQHSQSVARRAFFLYTTQETQGST